jgi:site-specific recombinase XerD
MGGRLSVRVVSGPLAPYASGYGSWLAARGYSPWTISHRRRQLQVLSCWLKSEGLAAGELGPECVERFLLARRAAGYSPWLSARSVVLPVEYLREVGVVPSSPAVVADGPVEEVLAGYRRYMLSERGVKERTVAGYEPDARVFLFQREGLEGLRLERLTAADVSAFLARECPLRSVAGARSLVVVLRSLLRYLHVAGLIELPLEWAVPGVADLRDRSLPRGLEPAVVKKLLASCDRRRSVGRRDYAILLLLARLGLRAGEVAAVTLEDVDWRRGELLIHGKGGRDDVLPLPCDLGEALVSYLRRRPASDSRTLFLKVLAPAGPMSGAAIGGVVHDACVRAGIPPVGPHRLRHTAATGMLAAGASLAEIGQVLRHRERRTTAIYAKVDRKALRALARPWPEASHD